MSREKLAVIEPRSFFVIQFFGAFCQHRDENCLNTRCRKINMVHEYFNVSNILSWLSTNITAHHTVYLPGMQNQTHIKETVTDTYFH